MNKVEFMRQLESLLQNISEQERQEALQYYGDYFDDAGPENEQAVLEALGNPARVAENIRRDLYGAGYGDGYEARKPVTGRELTEYGTFVEEPQNQGSTWQNQAAQNGTAQNTAAQSTVAQSATAQSATAQNATAQNATAQSAMTQSAMTQSTMAQSTMAQNAAAQGAAVQGAGIHGAGPAPAAMAAGPGQSIPQPVPVWGNAGRGAQGQSGKAGKEPMSGGVIALIVILCIIGAPVGVGLLRGAAGIVAGILGGLLGLIAAWFAMILGFGIAALICILVGLFVCVVGVVGMGIHPLAGLGLVGGGLIAVSIGIFFLMATVAMAGVATPAIFRGIRWLFTRKKKAA